MRMEPIRIRLVPRKRDRETSDLRQAFWQAVTDVNGDAKACQNIDRLEGMLCREFGPQLRSLLIQYISEPIRHEKYDFRHLGDFLLRFFERPRLEKIRDQDYILDIFTRLLEQRPKLIRESPGYGKIQEKIAATSTVIFSITIVGYSSLVLDLSVGSLNKIAEIFENDFDSFRIFLDVFVPITLKEVFSSNIADEIEYHINIPDSYSQVFAPFPSQEAANTGPAAVPTTGAPSPQSGTTARDRAEWLWRLANGSLLVPCLLALFVLYQGMILLQEIRASEQEAMKPFLDHQLKLLEEDRHRLFREPPPPATSPPAAARQP